MRSAPAKAISIALNCSDIIVIGWEKDLVYCRKTASEPRSKPVVMDSAAPTIAVME